MEVKYTEMGHNGKERQETQSVARFLYDEILVESRYDSDSDKIRLEDQPKKVCEALGRLVEKLLDKGILDLEDLKYISDISWGRKFDTLELKKE